MRTRIPLEHLAVGMYVSGLDRPWVVTPFFRHRMVITSPSDIDKLRACGVQYVEIDTEYGSDGPGEEPAGDEFTCARPHSEARSTSAGGPTPPAPPPSPGPSSFEEELPAATEAYRSAKAIVQRAMSDLRMGREINTEAVAHVVDRLVDSILRHEGALTSLSRVKSFDEYTFYHSVNTAVLALALGRSLQMDRETLRLLGMGTLLHDVGKTKLPLQILNKPDRFTNVEYEIIKQHPLRGAEILSGTAGLPEAAVSPALEHHERVNGTGYPHRRKGHELSQFGMICSIVDIYDAVTSDRVYHKALPPHEAVQFLYRLGQRGHLETSLVERFITCVGIYPVGTCVQLDTGEVGLVTEVHSRHLLKPRLLLLRDRDCRPVDPPRAVDLLAQTDEPVRTIVGPLNPRTLGIDPDVYLDATAQGGVA